MCGYFGSRTFCFMGVHMDIFNLVAGACSILGLIVAIIALRAVSQIRAEKGSTIISGKGNTVYQNNPTTIIDPMAFLLALEKEKQMLRESLENNENESMTFTVVADDGKITKCEVLFTFESEENGNNYIVYTDNTTDEDDNTRVYASIYMPDVDETKLLPIKTEREWSMIEIILDELQQDLDETTIQKRINNRLEKLK